MPDGRVARQVEELQQRFADVHKEVAKVIVGHTETIREVLVALLCGGHVLLEGVPGLGKTLLVRTLGRVLDLDFSRIQFTPDLMPADILGTNVIMQNRSGERYFEFQHGPIFAQIVLADEINRATPKTQSALLEAMQEYSVTVSGKTYDLKLPFCVLATQNPLEMEGTYPLPEAQVDRFFFKLLVSFPGREELGSIIDRTTGPTPPEVSKIASGEDVLAMQQFVLDVPLASHVKDYAIRLVLACHPEGEFASEKARQYVRYGPSPRGVQALILAGKAHALLDGRYSVSFDDIRRAALPALRHRIILNFEAEAEGIAVDELLQQLISEVPEELPDTEGKATVG